MFHVELTNALIKIIYCPLCGADKQEPFLECKDYTVSNECFNIVTCQCCNFKFTNPRPTDECIGNYYKSEDYISHSDSSQGLTNKLYHLVRKVTLKNKLKLINGYVSRGTILDYGCGTGAFIQKCSIAGWKAFGFEPDNDARKIALEKGLAVYNNKDSLLGNIFDIISLWHVLEHLTDLNETLTFINERLSKNGHLIIAVPNHISYDANIYKEFWAGYDVPRHIYHFEATTIEKLLRKFGFILVETKPMKFDSYYVSLLSEKNKTGSTKYFSAFLNGVVSNLKAGKAINYSSVIYIFKKA